MPKSTDVRVVSAELSVSQYPFRTPLKFGGRVMSESRLLDVQLTVETRGGKHATGFGSMPVGNVWAWPSDVVSPQDTCRAMEEFAERVVRLTDSLSP